MTTPLVIGYYTEGTPYEGEAQVLKLSLESHGYEHDVRGVPNLGSWQRNTQYKAHVIHDRLQDYPGRRLLYLDVDAVMVQPPRLLDKIKEDVAAVHFADTKELLSGTFYLSGSLACLQLVKRWIAINEQYPEKLPNGRDAWDQRTLAMAIDEMTAAKRLTFRELPQGYTYITELTPRRIKNLQPVILHTRGAKRFKNIINGLPGYAQ